MRGLSNLNDNVKGLQEHVVTLERTTAFATDTATAAKLTFHLEALRAAHAQDAPAERAKVSRESESWNRFLALRNGKPQYAAIPTSPYVSRTERQRVAWS
jgi:hypothetical protein